jgi:hypothetical protein
MNRILFPLATASILAIGCGRAALTPEAAAPAVAAAPTREAREAETLAKAEAAAETAAAKEAPAPAARMPGDYVVYRFSGTFRKTPLKLTQKVIERRGAILTIDLIAEDGETKEELRVKIDEASATRNDVVAVARLVDGAEKPATIDAYEKLMARTALAADQNEEFLGTEETLVDVGGAALPVHKTKYRVRIGKRRATLSTLESASFPWGDVGGEIKAANGKVLYRAEVLETGRDEGVKGPAVADSASP